MLQQKINILIQLYFSWNPKAIGEWLMWSLGESNFKAYALHLQKSDFQAIHPKDVLTILKITEDATNL